MPVDVVALTTEELFQYLSVELNEGIATVMKKENISGVEFHNLTEEDLKERLTLGDREKVMKLIRKYSQPMPKVAVSSDSACAPDEKESSERVCEYLLRHSWCMHMSGFRRHINVSGCS